MIPYNRLLSLRNHHARLERLITDEQRRPYPDFANIKRMKLRKLAIKQEISSLSSYTDSSAMPKERYIAA